MSNASIMVVEDKYLVAQDLAQTLERLGYSVPAVVSSGEDAIGKAGESQPDLVLMDIRLRGEIDGIQAAAQLREKFNIPVIYLTAYADDDSIQRAKATEPLGYLLKPFEERQLYTTIEMALNRARSERQEYQRRASLKPGIDAAEQVQEAVEDSEAKRWTKLRSRKEFAHLIAEHASMLQLLERVELVARTDVSVHIYGENGTGKELVADSLHNLSERRGRNFVKLNCSAIPATLLESALFGHVKGAFTGANKDQQGFIEHAQGGTLFLDEIGDLSHETQVKLLRLLQNREYSKVGETRVRSAEIRIITATNRNLKDFVRSGKMREDFYYRVNVFPLVVPPLRERSPDIILLANYFIEMFGGMFSKEIQGLTAGAERVLLRYAWPGNVRELENAIKHAFVVLDRGYIGVEHLPSDVVNSSAQRGSGLDEQIHLLISESCEERHPESEREVICEALRKTSGNRSKAAELLGYSRVTLWKKINKYNLESFADTLGK